MRNVLLLIISTFFFIAKTNAQTVAVINVNGTGRSLNDTIKLCIGSTLNYTSASLNVSTTNWTLNGGTPAVFAGITPGVVTYNTAGIHQTFLLVTNGPDRDSTYIYVDVSNQKPMVGFTFTPNNQCGGTPISFTSTTTGLAPLTYSWAWGDATPGSNLQNDVHTYQAMGPPYPGTKNYTVKHYATTSYGCRDSATQIVNFKTTPHDSLVRGNTLITFSIFNGFPTFSYCVNQGTYGFQFLNKSLTAATNTSYTIKWGDGSMDSTFTNWPVSPATIITHNFPAGNSIMTVLTTGTDGCVTERKYNVFLGSNPSVGLSSPGSTSACAPVSFTFGINSFSNNPPGTIYEISVNDGSPLVTLTHPPPLTYTHNFNKSSCNNTSFFNGMPFPNSFTASIVAKNPCGQTPSGVASIYISKKPISNILLNPGPVICANVPLIIINGTTAGAYINPGNASTCVTTAVGVWEVTPNTGFVINSGSLGTTNGSNNTALWTPGSASLNISFTNPTNYTIKLVSANDCGIDTADKPICVRSAPTANFTMSADSSCGMSTVDFTNNSAITGACVGNIPFWSVAYQDLLGCGSASNSFTFTGGSSATSISPKIQFNNPGRYIITLTMRANSPLAICPNAIFRDTFWVKGKPKISVAPISTICINNTISPIATVSNCYANQSPSYAWSFNNGLPNTSNILNPTNILYGINGAQNITFAVTNECGTTTVNPTFNVGNAPVANAGIDKETCSGVAASIGSSAVGGVTYSWAPTTGLVNANLAATTVNLIYNGINTDTTYEYIVTASTGANCFTKDTVLVKIKKGLQIAVNPTSASICAGDSVKLTVAGANAYTWNPLALLSIVSIDTVFAKPIITTTYSVLGSQPNGCNDSKNILVTVKPLPNTNAGNDVTVCNTTSAHQMVGSPTGGVWSGNANINATGLFNAVASGIGSFTVYYTVTLNGCSKTDSAVINVVSAVAINAGVDTTVCQNTSSFQLIGSPVGGTWSGAPSVNAAGIFTPNTAGNINVTYTLGSGSCLVTDVKQVIVQPIISNNVINSNQQICINNAPAIITGNTPNGGNGIFTYQWQVSTNNIAFTDIPLATNQNYQPPILSVTTYYKRVATTTLCNPNTSSSVAITVKLNAKAMFTATRNIGCAPFVINNSIINTTVLPAQNSSYNWFVNGVAIGTNTTGLFPGYTMTLPNDSITIKLLVLSPFGCLSDTMIMGFKTPLQPTPLFTKSNNGGCAPIAVSFTNNTVNATSYQFFWNFGNGQTSTLINPLPIIYNVGPTYNDTSYTIKMGAYAGCDTVFATTTVAIKSKPKALFSPVQSTGCSPFRAAFKNNSLGMRIKYYWDYGDGVKDTTTIRDTAFHIYNTGIRDTFFVQLIAENECGRDTLIYNLIVDPNTIQLDFAYNATDRYGCLPHTVKFFNNSLGANNFKWDFGDGNFATTTLNVDTIVHTYTTAGNFVVKLRGQNDCSDTTGNETITVFAKPIVSFNAAPTNVCIGDTVYFTNTSEPLTSLLWNFGDGTSATNTNPKKVYATAGNFTAKLYGSKVQPSSLICSDSANVPISVFNSRPGSFFISDTIGNCVPFTIALKNTSITGGSTLWNFGNGGTAIGDSVNYTYTTPGTYILTMTATALGGCKYIKTRTIIVNAPTGTLNYTGGNKCNTATIAFTTLALNASQYKWNFGDGIITTTTANNIIHTYTTPGLFVPTVTLISTAGCEVILKTNDTIKVDKTTINFSLANTYNCGFTNTQFFDSSTAFFGVDTWQWSFGNSLTSTLQNPTTIYNTTNTYTVQLITKSKLGCIDTLNKFINIQVNTKPSVAISGNNTTCINQPLQQLAVVNSIDSISSFYWVSSTGQTALGLNPFFTFASAGNYTIKLIAQTIFGCKDSAVVAITVFPSFNLLKSADARICLGQSTNLAVSGGTAWNWSPIGGLSCTNCPNPIATPLVTTLYAITATNANGCIKKDSIKVEVVQPLNMSVSPNFDTLCLGESTALFATNATTYNWQPATALLPNANVANPIATPLTTTDYLVIGKDAFNCFTDTGFVRIVVGQPATVNIGLNQTVATGTPVSLTPIYTNGPFNNYSWLPNTHLSCNNCPAPIATIHNDIVYILKATSIYGCVATDTIAFTVFCKSGQVYLPNGFKPNGSNKYMVRGQGISAVKLFKIFNRAGQVVFERNNFMPNDPNFGWDGTINGQIAAPDVFVYMCNVVCDNGVPYTYKGNITLIR